MQINEMQFKKLPEHLKHLFQKLSNHGSEEVLACFPDAPGQQGDVSGDEPSEPLGENTYGRMKERKAFKARRDGEASAERRYTDDGATNFAALPGERRQATSAARFFYCAKASREDRNVGLDGMPTRDLNWSSGTQSPGTFQSPNTNRAAQNFHPTVKPTELMRYLVRLVTPKGGTVLDPYAGSGSTGRAADIEGFDAILIEREAEYVAIARQRIHGDAPLFANLAPDGEAA